LRHEKGGSVRPKNGLKISVVPFPVLGNPFYLYSRSWLHLFPNPALDRCELPAAPSSGFGPVGRVSGIRAVVGLFGSEVGLGSVEISCLPGDESRSPCCPSCIIVTVPTEISRILISESLALRILLPFKSCYLLSFINFLAPELFVF
jgi:hypothetical protein